MKILWLCNVVLPPIAKQLQTDMSVGGGWLVGALNGLREHDDIDLAVCFPFSYNIEGTVDQLNYFSFSRTDSSSTVRRFSEILRDFSPDIVHIFGTEYRHTLDMVEACEQYNISDKVVISVQGLVSVCAKHYYAGLPGRVVHSYTLRDFLKNDNIYRQKKAFEKRGLYEKDAIRRVKHLIGRTDWDKACTQQINPNATYHFCNETLRPAFYGKTWDGKTCEKYSIFVSQCNYPLKGMHHMLEAMAEIVKYYPGAKLYTTGRNPLKLTLKQKLYQGYYSKYLGKLIKKYSLEKNVEFLGSLEEEAMCQRYLKSNVFVCCSSIENSPNSVGEAMILGVPVVSSDIGGVKNMLQHKAEGFVYPADAPYMLAYYVMKLFEDEALQRRFSQNAKLRAESIYDPQLNTQTLMNIYGQIFAESGH